MPDTIRLDPDLFMALGLSAEAHGGIGSGSFCDGSGIPLCVYGHVAWLDNDSHFGPVNDALDAATDGGWATRNDAALAGIQRARVPFTTWLELVGVDCA